METVRIFAKIPLMLVFLGVMLSFSARAEAATPQVTLKDVQTIMRTIGFLENSAPSGAVMAILYDPNNAASTSHAQTLEKLLKSEKNSPRPRLVSINSPDLSGASFAFMTDGLQSHYKQLRAALEQNKILSFTITRDCIDQNCCSVYINSKNRVEIVVNKASADKVRARFKPVFLMMVTVI